ncbi:AUXIN-REGULATED GENE INVOLVED IN ORGAN SIZE-like, partial [Olea europaea subsp. europaea]
MKVRTAKRPSILNKSGAHFVELRKSDSFGSSSKEHGKRMFRYFTLESLLLLVCITASLLILPLVLPPLPPPPFMLLLVPICLLVLLIVLAFMPSNFQNVTYS